ncbi:MAG TPA: ornithine carbamoyltransferase [Candidatus Limnocylindria bacterium]|nr:ornithine carbamoyltransferase [Candidatus Limnocylindria bacterium]
MPVNLRHRDFLKELDFTTTELSFLLDLSRDLKRAKYSGTEVQRMSGKNVALIFEKTSTRTRCAFEVGCYDQGARVTYLDPSSSQLGHKESAADTGKVLSRMFDAIEFRGSAQATVQELADSADVPVYNGLTDEWHPTQMLADFLTMIEHSRGRPIEETAYCYMGDARSNMGHSLLVMGAIMGADVRIAAPKDLWPGKDVIDAAQERAVASGARITLTEDPDEGLTGADFVHTDVWVSMGEPKEVWDQRVKLLTPYQVNTAALARTGKPNAKFMHCLPAFHDTLTVVGKDIAEKTGMTEGLEVTDEVFQSPANIAFDQAENRLHTIKAIMVATIGD